MSNMFPLNVAIQKWLELESLELHRLFCPLVQFQSKTISKLHRIKWQCKVRASPGVHFVRGVSTGRVC